MIEFPDGCHRDFIDSMAVIHSENGLNIGDVSWNRMGGRGRGGRRRQRHSEA